VWLKTLIYHVSTRSSPNGLIQPNDQADCLSIRSEVAPEIFEGNCEGDASLLLLNDGTGNFTDATPAFIDPLECDHGIDIADLDNDGDLDIVIARREGQQNAILINDGSGNFTDETPARFPVMVDTSNEVEVGDFDGDGDIDLVFGTGDPNIGDVGANIYLENDGTGVFTDATAASGLPGTIFSTTDIESGDVDGDADLDLVIGNWGEANQLLRNTVLP